MTETRDLEPKMVVRESYNCISRAYRGDTVSRDRGYFRWLAVLTPLLQPGDPVLDLGCGCGIPVAQELARTFRVTGVDISEVQITRAQALVPEATLLCQDIMAVHFPPRPLRPLSPSLPSSICPCRSNVLSLRASSSGCGPVAISWSPSDTGRGQATKTRGTGRPCIGVRPMRPRTWPGCGTGGSWCSGDNLSRRALMGMSWCWHSDHVTQPRCQEARGPLAGQGS
jgi:hypothetical protein